MSPLDDCITHKPNENKYDVVTGIIPFETVNVISGISFFKINHFIFDFILEKWQSYFQNQRKRIQLEQICC